jgi:hypothetical protein
MTSRELHATGDFHAYRKSAIRFWERRRILFNALLIPPALFTYYFGRDISMGVGDAPAFGLDVVAILFFISAGGANACYSIVYMLEFWMADSNLESGWQNGGRTGIYVIGVVIAIGLALMGGREICLLQYSPDLLLPF